MKRESIAACCLLSMFLLFQVQAGDMAQAQGQTTKKKVTFIRGVNAFRQAANLEAFFSPQAITLRPAPLVALRVGFSQEAANGRGEEIWIAEPDGKRPRRLVNRVKGGIETIRWSPDGTRICYHVQSVSQEKGLYIVEVPGGRRTQISQSIIRAPQWTADGRELLFWQPDPEQKGWQPHRAGNLMGPGPVKVEAVSDSILQMPGVFSPDGQRWAALSPQLSTVVIETLATHERTNFPLSGRVQPSPVDPGVLPILGGMEGDERAVFVGAMELEFMQWSGDKQWIYLEGYAWGVNMARPQGLLLHTGTGKLLSVNQQLQQFGALAAPKEGEDISVSAGIWIPGQGNRLFLRATRSLIPQSFGPLYRSDAEDPEHPIRERRWLIYDVDAGTTQQIEGIDENGLGILGTSAPFVWSPDGQMAWLGIRLYDFSAVR